MNYFILLFLPIVTSYYCFQGNSVSLDIMQGYINAYYHDNNSLELKFDTTVVREKFIVTQSLIPPVLNYTNHQVEQIRAPFISLILPYTAKCVNNSLTPFTHIRYNSNNTFYLATLSEVGNFKVMPYYTSLGLVHYNQSISPISSVYYFDFINFISSD